MTGSGDDSDDVWDPFEEENSTDAENGNSTDATDAEDGNSTDAPGVDDAKDAPGLDDDAAGSGRDGDGSTETGRDGTSTSDDRTGEGRADDAVAEIGGDRARTGAGATRTADPPKPEPSNEESPDGPIRWVLSTDHAVVATVREVLSSVALVAVLGLILFGASGIWPPLVAVESGSMEPHMWKGDLVFVVDNGRYAPNDARAGVVTWRQSNPELSPGGQDGSLANYWSFGNYGNVVVYRPNGADGTPIIHRARFYVEKGDNWYDEANPDYVGGADSCEELRSCPAPHDGFITKGDHNGAYDQVAGPSTVVKPEWIRGVAKVRVPWLGCIRLELSGTSCF